MMAQRHYFDRQPDGQHRPGTVPVEVAGLSFELLSDAGVFSRERLDPGTRVLLAEMPWPQDDGRILDLGCGYGPIACALGLHRPSAEVFAVDSNERAVELTRANARRLELSNVTASLPERVPESLRFRSLYSNPPVRIGKQALHELLLRWLGRLTDDGTAWLVVQRNLGADSLARWLGERGYRVARLSSHRGFRVLRVDPG